MMVFMYSFTLRAIQVYNVRRNLMFIVELEQNAWIKYVWK